MKDDPACRLGATTVLSTQTASQLDQVLGRSRPTATSASHGYQRGHLTLTLRQLSQNTRHNPHAFWACREFSNQPARNAGRQQGVAGRNHAHRLEQVVGLNILRKNPTEDSWLPQVRIRPNSTLGQGALRVFELNLRVGTDRCLSSVC